MKEMDPEENQEWMRQRIRQLRNQLDEISGGEAVFGGPEGDGADMPLEVELQFLEQVVGFETAPITTWRAKLSEAGYEMPSPESLDDQAVSFEVWQVIQRLAELHVYLDRTDHLSDRELYEKLNVEIDEPVEDFFLGPGSGFHLELLAAGVEEDDRIWLRYFADEETRQRWREDFDLELPPKESPPHDRDRLLPKQEIPESPELKFARRLAETAWDPDRSPMKLASDLKAAEVEGVVALELARTLLEAIGARGKVKPTAKRGMLPRAMVREVFENQPFPPERIQTHHDLIGTFDEDRVTRIHFVRVACQQAGLLRKHAGAFQLTKKGARLLARDRAGDLYVELFRAGCSKVNLAAFDGSADYPALQASLPVVLLCLVVEDTEWIPIEAAAGCYLLPEPYYELTENEPDEGFVALTFWLRILRWLEDFGLLDCAVGGNPTFRHTPDAVRISDLGRRVIHIDRPVFPNPWL